MLCSLSQSRCPLRERERERERELYLAGASCGALARDMAGTWTTRSLPHRAPRLPPGPRLGMMIGRCAPAARNALLPSLRKQVLARLRLCAVIVVRDFIESKLPMRQSLSSVVLHRSSHGRSRETSSTFSAASPATSTRTPRLRVPPPAARLVIQPKPSPEQSGHFLD